MAGAIGYLIKPTMTDDLAHALADAMDGHAAMCAEAERKLLECLWRAGSGSAFEVLTRREREIMSQLIANSSDKELAERCRIAPNTVHVHLVRIFRKLGVHSREQALNKFLSVPSLVVSDTIRSEEAT
jgi:DNA-binding NarL/FixJ family response regulator